MLSYIWVIMVGAAFAVGAVNGRLDAVGAAAMEGAAAAVELCLAIAGPICLWSGVMELLRVSGATERLSRMIAPCLSKLFPAVSGARPVMEKISANVSANIDVYKRQCQRCGRSNPRARICAAAFGGTETELPPRRLPIRPQDTGA